jgi:tellurite methyltransferase
LKHYDHPSGPASFLVENIDLLPPGRAMDIAMGAGRNAIYLAQRGYDVTGIDLSPESVVEALKKAREAGVSINAVVEDLEETYRIEPDHWDVIICFNYLHLPLFPAIRDGLKPGGMIVYETYIIDQMEFGRPHNPDFLLRHNELLEEFRNFRCLRYREGILGPEKAAAGIIAQKPFAP